MRVLPVLFLSLLSGPALAAVGEPPSQATMPTYASLIVKACPEGWGDTPLEPAVPENAGNNHWQKPDYSGCVDVPVPPWVFTREFDVASCKGTAGYIASMEFLAQQSQYSDWMVGGWTCHVSSAPPQQASAQ